jgi:hypothetical protein
MTSNPTPTLLKLLLGDSAEIALAAASPRLLTWCQAYEDWLAQQRLRSVSAAEQASWAWRTNHFIRHLDG